jgi:hypothetical protein
MHGEKYFPTISTTMSFPYVLEINSKSSPHKDGLDESEQEIRKKERIARLIWLRI